MTFPLGGGRAIPCATEANEGLIITILGAEG